MEEYVYLVIMYNKYYICDLRTVKHFNLKILKTIKLSDYEKAGSEFYFDKDGNFILGKTSEKKKEEIRLIRDSYLRDTDKYVLIPDYPITDEERELYKAYRVYLRDYPESSENWYESEPLTFEKWKEQEDKK